MSSAKKAKFIKFHHVSSVTTYTLEIVVRLKLGGDSVRTDQMLHSQSSHTLRRKTNKPTIHKSVSSALLAGESR